MAGDRQVMDNHTKVLLLDKNHRLKAILHREVEGKIGWIQQHILVRLIFREEKVRNSEYERIKLIMLANKVTLIVRLDSTFLHLMKIFLNFAMAFGK